MQIYSPYMLKTFEQCSQKFNIKYNEKFSLVQNSKYFEKGKNIHALASYYLQGFSVEKLEKSLDKSELLYWENLKNSEYFKKEVVNIEYNLSCKIGDFWIGGRLDAIVHDDDNYYILDYKTGEIPKDAQTDFQTIIYLLATDKFLSKKNGYKSLSFVYLGLKKNDVEKIEFNSENKKMFEEKIIKTCKEIELSKFTKNKKHCDFCEYKKLCN